MVNQLGPFLGMRAAIPVIERSGGGAIVNIASSAGHQGMPMMVPYAASKHAVIGMSKSVALELAGSGIRVNSVSPGGIDTPLLRATNAIEGFEEQSDELMRAVPLMRWGNPEEVAQAIVFLLSDDASYITGTDVRVDGGATAH
jgi:3alpha(or 20beta)-hydroxysteroid dehydrogenase